MIENEDVTFTYIEDLKDPRSLFSTVMFYADFTQKNPWECMGYVFNQNHHTIIIWYDNKIIGYISTEVTGDGELFIHHACCKYWVKNKPKLLDDMIKMIGAKLQFCFPKAIMHSERSGRAWEKWGFKQSDMIIYEREVD